MMWQGHGAAMDSTSQVSENRAIVLAHERPFRLGVVEIRPSTREIVGPTDREVLEPRVMQVLVALARADGEFLTRDDLTASCWEGRVVGEDAISRVISRLRRALARVGRDAWVLETVTKVGYRLRPSGEEPVAVGASEAEPARPHRRAVFAIAGGVLALAAGGGAWWVSRPRPMSPKARALYDKGVEAMRQGLPEPVAQAIGFLREAVAEAPEDARCWGALSLAYWTSLNFVDPARQAGVRAQAEAAAKRALELDASDPDASATTALLTPHYRNWVAADARYARALELHPRQPALLSAYARLLLGVGRIRESVSAAEAAVAADRYSPVNRHGLARSLWSAGRTEEAERVLREALDLWPEHYALWFLRFNLLAHTGRPAQAVALAQAGDLPGSVPPADVALSVAGARAMANRAPDETSAAVRAFTDSAHEGVGFAEGAMNWLCGLGETAEAFRIARAMYFEEGFAIGERRYSPEQRRFMIGGSRNTHNLFMPPTAPMRSDERFRVLARDLGLRRYWQASGRPPDVAGWV